MSRTSTPKSRFRAFLGPVADLESHLPQEWWRELFDSLYLYTDGDVVENDVATQREVDILLRATGLSPADRILDLCCGQGRHALELARRGFGHVTGVDRSRYLVRLARRRAADRGLPVTFREGDARHFRLREGEFDAVILMGNSFGYFESEQDDAKVLGKILSTLRPGGQLALDLADGEWMRGHFERRSWEWIDQNHFVCRERSLDNSGERLISREVIVHGERGVIADQFYAERLYSAERITALLEKAGFGQIRIHESVMGDSTRNQDLGMMAHRLFLTAVAPPKKMTKPAGRKSIVNVTVLLGDPRLPDMVKRGGKFNPEDMDTINRLKNALSALEGYSFSYLDNHAAMLSELRGNPPDMIFNLCDEGFNNDAFKELHVPAYLDMLEVPYTGAGPSCLALCYDKGLVRAAAQSLDIPVPQETFVRFLDQSATLPSIFPAILKPNFGDSSIGITERAIVRTPAELMTYFGELRESLPGRPILVQEFLTGDEYSVGLIGNPQSGLRALPVLEVDYSDLQEGKPRILGYESKWLPDSPYWTQIRYRQAVLDPDDERLMIEYSSLLFERLNCRDYARFDFRRDANGIIKLLEINPNPGWCWDGKMNLMAEFGNQRYSDLLRMILDAAQERELAAGRSLTPSVRATA